MSDLSGLNPTPHAIAVYASSPLSPVATQHSLPSGRYSLLGPDFHRLDRTSLRLAHSLDHLIGAQNQAGRNFMTDGVRCFKIDYQFERGRLLNRKIGRLGATQHLDDDPRSLTIDFSETRTVTREATSFRHVRPLIDCRQPQRRDPFDDKATVVKEQRCRQNVQRLGAPRLRTLDRGRDLFEFGNAKNRKLDATSARALLQRLKVMRRGDPRVGQRRHPASTGYRLQQKVLSLSIELGREQADSRCVAAWPGKGFN